MSPPITIRSPDLIPLQTGFGTLVLVSHGYSFRNHQNFVCNRCVRCYSSRSAPRCPMFSSRWTKIRGSLVRSEWESHSDHDCSHLYVSFCLFIQLDFSPLPAADPLGSAVGQIVSPFLTNIRFGILVLAIITSASLLLAFAVLEKPPTPPSTRQFSSRTADDTGSLTLPPHFSIQWFLDIASD